MEINVKKLEMDKLNTYIRIFDDVLIKENLKWFTKICEEHVEYESAKVTNHEGFVAFGIEGGAVKLNDRMEFNALNFATPKNWK